MRRVDHRPRVCAFCGIESSKLTREHVIPRFIVARRTTKWDTFLQSEERFFTGEAQIGDVCAECNSGRLSELDSYVSKLWPTYFEKIVDKRDRITLCYDFDLLAGWLLKVSFNVARANRNADHSALLRRYAPFILGRAPHPRLSIYLELMTPHRLTEVQERKIHPLLLEGCPRDADGRVVVEPEEIRPTAGRTFGAMTIRLLALNSYYFYLLLANRDASDSEWNKLRRKVRPQFRDAEYIHEDKTEITIAASRADFFDSKAPHLKRYREAYRQRRAEYISALEGKETKRNS